MLDQFNSLRRKGLEGELARTKTEVELKRNQIAKDGLFATEADQVELEVLKRQVELLENRTKLGLIPGAPDPVGNEIAELKRQVELQRLRRQLSRLEGS